MDEIHFVDSDEYYWLSEKLKEFVRLGQKVMLLIRGAPAMGKTILAQTLLNDIARSFPAVGRAHCETDSLFYDPDTSKYVYDTTKLNGYHEQMLNNTRQMAEEGKHRFIVVSNTFTQSWEMQNYISCGLNTGFRVIVYDIYKFLLQANNDPDMKFPGSQTFQKLLTRLANVSFDGEHKVPKENIKRMLVRYEFSKYVAQEIYSNGSLPLHRVIV